MPDLQSELKKATKVLKVPTKPLVERVWLWINDHPRSAPKAIAAALGIRRELIQVSLTNMNNRGMVVKVQSDLKNARKNFMLWSIEPTMLKYELLPTLSHAEKTRRDNLARGCSTAQVVQSSVAVPNPEPKGKLSFDVDKLNVKEARELYDKLKLYFS